MAPELGEIIHNKKKAEPLQNFDTVIFLGDMNYRISTSDSEIVEYLMRNNQWDELVKNDQLYLEKKIKRVADGYSEGPINFAPTFKFKAKTDNYNFKREPSWTDRILYRSNNKILKLMNYDSNNLVNMSDHRPVFA